MRLSSHFSPCIKAIAESSKLVSFLVNEDVKVQYALEFDAAGTALRRIAAKVDHLSFGYRNPKSVRHSFQNDDFDAGFLCWASRYLKTSVDSIFKTRKSIVKLIDDEKDKAYIANILA